MAGRHGRGRAAGLALLLSLPAVAGCAPRLQEPGPLAMVPAAPSLEADGFTTADGFVLPVRRWLPANRPRAAMVALHGFNDYSKAFEAPGRWLADRGIAVYAYDQRGFGETPQRGIWPGVPVMVEDLKAMARLVGERHPETPLILLGESMGAAVVMVALAGDQAPPHDRAILVAPAVWSRTTMPAVQATGLDLIAHIAPWLPVDGRGYKRRPSDNVDMLRALGRDPLVIKETRFDAVYGMVNLMDQGLEAAERLDGRVLILLGEQEDIIPEKPVQALLARLPSQQVDGPRVAIYAAGYHMLLRDLQADVVLTDIAHWIADPQGPLPSAADRRGAARLAAEP